MFRRIAVIFLIAFAALWASSADAGRRRAVDKGGTIVPSTRAVEMGIAVLYYDDPWDESETKQVLVVGWSLSPLVLGTRFTAYVQKPGQAQWTWITEAEVEEPQVGKYQLLYLYYGDQFYDKLPDGSRQPWVPGVAPFKVDILTAMGERTSVSTRVNVPPVGVAGGSPATPGPVQQVVVAADGRNALLLGDFPNKTTLVWYQEVPTKGAFRWYPVEMAPDHTIPVPSEIAGSPAFLLACHGYPNSECWTYYVQNLPRVSQN